MRTSWSPACVIACVIACLGWLGAGCGEPVIGDFPMDAPGPNEPARATCLDGDLRRDVVVPRPGAVRIVEWMANPAGPDAQLEWVEVWFGEDADLHGFLLGTELESANAVVGGDDCAPVGAGSWVVFGASPAAAPRVDAELPFSLPNTGPRHIVAVVDGALLDRVDYEGAVEGVSAQLDQDDARCETTSTMPYSGVNLGTPGEPNPTCERMLLEGQCFDQGVPRAIDRPGVGDVSIREWMANPAAVDNRSGEWVEIRFERAVDLNGLTLADLTGQTVFESEACVGVPAGARVVFARESDAAFNGGIEVTSYPLSISLNNRDETIELSVDGEVLDSVSYARSEPGVAQQVDDEGRSCAAVRVYGDGDLGTPGEPNPPCT